MDEASQMTEADALVSGRGDETEKAVEEANIYCILDFVVLHYGHYHHHHHDHYHCHNHPSLSIAPTM